MPPLLSPDFDSDPWLLDGFGPDLLPLSPLCVAGFGMLVATVGVEPGLGDEGELDGDEGDDGAGDDEGEDDGDDEGGDVEVVWPGGVFCTVLQPGTMATAANPAMRMVLLMKARMPFSARCFTSLSLDEAEV